MSEEVLLICPIGRDKQCDGDRVSCPHCRPHTSEKTRGTCGEGICSRLSITSPKKPKCVEI